MKKPARQCKPQPTTTAKVINFVRPLAAIAKNDDAGSAPASDPSRNYFANSNGSRWGHALRSK